MDGESAIPIIGHLLKMPTLTTDLDRRHDGKEAIRMARKAVGGRTGNESDPRNGLPASTSTVKVTLHLSVATAQRLGVESAMRRISQSAIANEVLAAYLSRWQLPAVGDAPQLQAAEAGNLGLDILPAIVT
jgi:hypothetical protein